MEQGQFRPVVISKPHEQIQLKFDFFDYVHHRPHTPMMAAAIRDGLGAWVKLYPRVLFTHAKLCIARSLPSKDVLLSLRLSNPGIVSKQLNLS